MPHSIMGHCLAGLFLRAFPFTITLKDALISMNAWAASSRSRGVSFAISSASSFFFSSKLWYTIDLIICVLTFTCSSGSANFAFFQRHLKTSPLSVRRLETDKTLTETTSAPLNCPILSASASAHGAGPPDKFKKNNPGNYRAFEKYSYRIAYKHTATEIRILRVRHVKQEPKEY